MAISYVGQVTGTTTATLPTHQAGDLILVFAFRDGSNTAPSLDGNYTNVGTAGANTCSYRTGFRIAPGAGTSSGTWANATSIVCLIYRGCDNLDPIGAQGTNSNTNGTANYPAITMEETGGSSWVVAFGGSRSIDTNMQDPPGGMSNRATSVDATDEVAGYDTNGTTLSWISQNVTLGGTNSGWRTHVVEILAQKSITGISSLSFTTSGELTGVADIAGTSSVSFTTSGELSGVVDTTGTSSLTFSTLGDITGFADTSGSTTLAFTTSLSIEAVLEFSGSTSLTFTLMSRLNTVPELPYEIYHSSSNSSGTIFGITDSTTQTIYQESSGSSGSIYGES